MAGVGDDLYAVNIIKTAKGALALQTPVKEFPNQGNDTLELHALTDLGFTKIPTVLLPANFENLDASQVHSANEINLTGNTAVNILTGNDADNILDGGAGADTMTGGDGDDTYIFDDAGDSAAEDINNGADTVSIAYRNVTVTPLTILMADLAYDNIENVTVTGKGLFDVTGNDLDNALTGNASVNALSGGLGNDRLDGGAGADALDGGDGDDTYVIDTLADTIIDSDGTDTVEVNLSKGTYVLPSFIEYATLLGIKNLNLTGNDADNLLRGNNGSNILNGLVGQDYMEGGKGNDIYYVDNAGDIVVENFFEGADTIYAAINFSLLTGGFNVENLVLTGTAANATGNTAANTVTGNALANMIDGKAGADKLLGGAGSDTYLIDVVQNRATIKMEDIVTEKSSEGLDTIRLRDTAGLSLTKAVTFKVAANVENFDITDTDDLAINVTGNSLNNILTGNDGVNTLNGGAGHDLLIGGEDADILVGGAGADRFQYKIGAAESGAGHMDIIKDFAAGDKITFENATGLSYYGAYETNLSNAAAVVADIESNVSIDDMAVYFKIGGHGYLYVKGDGDGLGTDYNGTLIMAEKKSTAFSVHDIEFNTVFETEGAVASFAEGDVVTGTLTNHTDTDNYSFTLDTPGVIQISIDTPTAFYASQPAYKIQLLNSGGGKIGEWSLGSDGKLTIPLLAEGDYSVIVTGVSSAKFSSDPYNFLLESVATTVLTEGNMVTRSIAEDGERDIYEISLLAGHAYSIEALSGGTVDPKIRIYDESGKQILVSDDTSFRYTLNTDEEIDGTSVDTHAAFIAPASGTYYISVESAYDPANPMKSDTVEGYRDTLEYVNYKSTYSDTGSYTLNVIDRDIDALAKAQISGGSYNAQADLGDPVTITFGFPIVFPDEFTIPGNGDIFSHGYVEGSFRGFSTAQQAEIRQIMEYWESLTGIDFVETAGTSAQVKFGWMKNTHGGGGSSYEFDENSEGPNYPVDESYYKMGTSILLLNSVSSNPQTTNISTNDFWGLINHELGHALGFEHTDAYTYFNNYAQVDVLPGGFDSDKFSVMSYLADMGMTTNPTTIQLFDIAAAQYMYGANMTTESGNTDWEFNEPDQQYYMTIWDGGGEDMLDTSGQTLGNVIYLQAGASSSIGVIGKFADVSASDVLKATIPGEIGDRAYNNVTIAFGVEIENAKGGAGDDFIVGNALGNKLWGNAGSDTLKGGDGNDLLSGGNGHDILYGGSGDDIFVFETGFTESSSDVIHDFDAAHDQINLSGLLTGFDALTSLIDDFLSLTTDGTNSSLYVDIDGTANTHDAILLATLNNVTGQDVQTLYDNGYLTVT